MPTDAELIANIAYRQDGTLASLKWLNACLEEQTRVECEQCLPDAVAAFQFPDGSILYQVTEGSAAGEILTQADMDFARNEWAAFQAQEQI